MMHVFYIRNLYDGIQITLVLTVPFIVALLCFGLTFGNTYHL